MKAKKITTGEYAIEHNGTHHVVRRRITSDTFTPKGWLIFTTDNTYDTNDTICWGWEAETKKEALAWIKEEVDNGNA